MDAYAVSSQTEQSGIRRCYDIAVTFGDCDPAGIVFYPNYYRWFDQCFHNLARELGINAIAERETGLIGMPLVEAGAKFYRPTAAFETVRMVVAVQDCARKTVRFGYTIEKDEELRIEGWEVRVWASRLPDQPEKLQARPIPDAVRALLLGG